MYKLLQLQHIVHHLFIISYRCLAVIALDKYINKHINVCLSATFIKLQGAKSIY